MDYQLQLFNQIIDIKLKNRKNNTKIETDNHLIFVEHPNVYTLGKSGDINNLLLNKNELDMGTINEYIDQRTRSLNIDQL